MTHHFDNMSDAASWATMQPAPRFYLSPKALSLYIGRLNNGDNLSELHENGRQRVFDLYERYEFFCLSNMGVNMSRERICEILVNEEAPRFYVGVTMAFLIIQREIERHRELMVERFEK